MNAELEAARDRVRDALIDLDRALFGERAPGDILTHWVIAASWTQPTDDPSLDASAVCDYSSMAMPWWIKRGLLEAAALYAGDERHGDGE